MNTLSKECYAYPDKKLYPVHTKQAALDSFTQFCQDVERYSKDRLKLISDNFIKAASIHGISFEYKQEQKPAVDSFITSNGSVIKMSKIASSADVDKAVDALLKARETVPLKDLRKIAVHIVNQCQLKSLDTEKVQQLHKLAGFGVGDAEQMSVQFRKRCNLIHMNQKFKSEFYSVYRNMRDSDPDIMYKKSAAICDMLDGIDRLYKLENYYGTSLQRPEDVCFKQTLDYFTEAAEDFVLVSSTGTVMSKKALLQNKDSVSAFLKDKYAVDIQSDEHMLSKVASLSPTGLKALLKELE